ncbi:MAG: hypothetical protein LBM70_09555, partial [Victivallales bacterium]|nr:hypothetical protein [Victivallales bacterium]
MFRINIPEDAGIFRIAALEFAAYTERMTGVRPEITTDFDGDLVVLGSESENPFTAQLLLDKKFPFLGIRSGSDDYFLKSLREGNRTLLLLGGGRPRALLYAVYAFFEQNGCAYFWDGDIVPRSELSLLGYDLTCSPRFEYRGIRYFAHRGLHRFQAEQWTLDDWKKEIDWILKKRLNLFMLRIGLDDLFQKAFPDIVPYPEDNIPPEKQFERSFNDRTHFWSLLERGKLRKALLNYAFERDLLHPEDTGTMSHWYSRTPKEFLDKKNPPFIPQFSQGYGEPSGLVWDIRQDEWLENYFKLTETHIREYGRGEIFHTIGLAEREVSEDKRVNHLWKLYAYRRIIGRLRKSYPDAPLLIASWDFCNNKWSDAEMKELIASFDPRNTIVFDYTSDSDTEEFWFMNWSIYRKFPWIFGIFEAYEPCTELCGNYDTIKRRLSLAADDPFCKGMVIWPENAHGDTLLYEFFAANAWTPEYVDIADFLPVFCSKRYPERTAEMLNLWNAFLPAIRCGYWTNNGYGGVIWAHLNGNWKNVLYNENDIGQIKIINDRVQGCIAPLTEAFRILSETDLSDPFICRDAIDMARSAASRMFQYGYVQLPLRRLS